MVPVANCQLIMVSSGDYWNHLYLLPNNVSYCQRCAIGHLSCCYHPSPLLLLSLFALFPLVCLVYIQILTKVSSLNDVQFPLLQAICACVGSFSKILPRTLCFRVASACFTAWNTRYAFLWGSKKVVITPLRIPPPSPLFGRRGQGEEASPELKGLRLGFLGDFM